MRRLLVLCCIIAASSVLGGAMTASADCSDITFQCFLPKHDPMVGQWAGDITSGRCWSWSTFKCKIYDKAAPARKCNRAYADYCKGTCKACWPGKGCWDTNGNKVP